MDNPINQKKELFFSENIIQVLSDILEKYKLHETEEQFFEKAKNNQPFSGEIITGIAKDLFRGSIKETELVSLLIDKLNMQKESAEALAIDVKQQLLPLLKEETIAIEEPVINRIPMTSEDDMTSIIKETPTTSVEENEQILKIERESAKEATIDESPASEEKLKPAPKRIRKTTIADDAKNIIAQPKQSKGPDRYREPIE